MTIQTMAPQTAFWAGEFGNAYVERNRYDFRLRKPFWNRILDIAEPQSILEVGCNIGLNLLALRELDDTVELRGIDINAKALDEAAASGLIVRNVEARDAGEIYHEKFDLVFTSGVLIHISPDDLATSMASIITASRRHVLAVEYPSDEVTEIEYRGKAERLWKRPYGNLYQDMGLRLIETGVAQGWDRCAYWLLEKR